MEPNSFDSDPLLSEIFGMGFCVLGDSCDLGTIPHGCARNCPMRTSAFTHAFTLDTGLRVHSYIDRDQETLPLGLQFCALR